MIFLAFFILILLLCIVFLKLSFMLTISFDSKGFAMTVKGYVLQIIDTLQMEY